MCCTVEALMPTDPGSTEVAGNSHITSPSKLNFPFVMWLEDFPFCTKFNIYRGSLLRQHVRELILYYFTFNNIIIK